jgi:hypothetical protein
MNPLMKITYEKFIQYLATVKDVEVRQLLLKQFEEGNLPINKLFKLLSELYL